MVEILNRTISTAKALKAEFWQKHLQPNDQKSGAGNRIRTRDPLFTKQQVTIFLDLISTENRLKCNR